MSSRLFWKLFLSFATCNCVAIAGVVWVGSSDASFLSNVGYYPLVFLVGLLLATWWIVRQVLKPVRRLTDAAEQMAEGVYHEPVYVGTQDEMGELAAQFNFMQQDMIARDARMQRLSTVLAAMNDGVISVDESHQVVFANEAAGRMLDFSPSDAQGRKLLESVRSHKLHELVVRLMASKGEHEIEMEWGEEKPRSLLVNATSFSDGPSAAIVMMIYNLSEVRRLEAMRRDFVANVSHELKTPLSSIKAYAETLSCGAINDEENRDRFVQQIEEQADRLNQLISDLLSLARIEQGNDLMEIRGIDVEQSVRLCVLDQQRAADLKNIELVVVPEGREVIAAADEDGLRQILINLIDNAIKYSPESGKVSVGWTQDAEQVSLYVQDTGIGIPKEMQERVFERFFRVDKARSRELGGTGLGLAIVKHLSQSFGGSVEVESKPGEGTRFTVLLPKVGSTEKLGPTQ